MEVVTQSLPLLTSVIALASLVLTVGLGILLAYHWMRYALAPATTVLAIIIYSIVSLLLLSGLLASSILSPL